MKAHKGRIERTTISVDNFKPSATITHYFLTHGHSDHCTGLTPTWNFNVIYTTAITKKFIISKYNMEPSIFIELEVGVRRIIPLIFESLSFAVTPIDANHCPGSVCYLFEGYWGRFMCTGDFRYKHGLFNNYNVIDVDRLYLDDTYCSPYYHHFLNDKQCALEINKIINLNENKHCKFMIAVDTLGKENIFIQLSILTQTLIIVNPERYKRLKLLLETNNNDMNISRYFNTNPENGYIFMVNKREISLSNLDRLNEKIFKYSQQTQCYTQEALQQFVGIMPSGWSINRNKVKISDLGSRFYTVTYSAHSSFEELCNAVRYIKPRSIIPIVDDKFSRAPQCFNDYLSKSKPTKFKIPPIIQQILNGNRTIGTIAIQHLSTNKNTDNIISRRIGKRKQISSLLMNRNRIRKPQFKYAHLMSNHINKAKILSSHSNKKNKKKRIDIIEPTQIEPTQIDNGDDDIICITPKKKQKEEEIIDLLTPSSDDKIDETSKDLLMPSLTISEMMENDDNFVGIDMLTQDVDLVITVSDDNDDNKTKDSTTTNTKEDSVESNITEISIHSDPFSYINNKKNININHTFSFSMSPPPHKKRKISIIISDDDDDDDEGPISFKSKRKRKRKQLVESQYFDDDDGYNNDDELDELDDMDDMDEIHEINNNEMGAIKVRNAKINRKRRENIRLSLSQSQDNNINDNNDSDKENENNSSIHILDIVPTLKVHSFYSGKKRKFNEIGDDDDDDINWQNGIDFVATYSGTDGEISDFQDENLLNNVCTQLYNDKNHDDNDSDDSAIFTTQRSRNNNNNGISNNVQIVDIIDLT